MFWLSFRTKTQTDRQTGRQNCQNLSSVNLSHKHPSYTLTHTLKQTLIRTKHLKTLTQFKTKGAARVTFSIWKSIWIFFYPSTPSPPLPSHFFYIYIFLFITFLRIILNLYPRALSLIREKVGKSIFPAFWIILRSQLLDCVGPIEGGKANNIS